MTLKEETKKALALAKNRANEAFKELQEKLKRGFDDYKIKGIDTSSSGMIQADNALKNLGQLKNLMVSGSLNFSSSAILKAYTMNFAFITDPQLKTAANSMGGYFDILASGIQAQEKLKQEYRVIALKSYLNISGGLITAALQGTLTPQMTSLLGRLGLGRLAASILPRQVLVALGMGAAAAKFTLGLSVAAALIYAGYHALRLFFESKTLERATKMADTAVLMQMFNPSSLLNLYNTNAFLLGTEIQNVEDTTGRLRILMGTEFEDLIEGETPETSEFSLASRVYQSAYLGEGSRFSTGFDIRGFGFDSAKILSVASNLERRTQTGYNEDVIANILFMSGALTGGDTGRMERIMENIIRANAFTEDDVNQASEKFEEFFAAVVGGGKPQASHLKMISTLSEFSVNYAMGVKANLDSTSEIAKIFQFMSDDGSINERFDASPVKTLITSVDDLLFKGATYTNLGAVSLLNALNISREEAIRGVTSDASIFERYISGLFSYLNVDNNDVLNQTSNFDVALQNFALKHNVSSGSLNTLMVAMNRYASGENIENVRKDYISNVERSINSNLNNANRGLDSAVSFFEILSNITYSSNKLLATTEMNLEVISSIQKMTQELVLIGFNNFADSFVSVFYGILGLERIKNNLQLVATGESFAPLGITQEELFDVGVGDSRNNEVLGRANLDLGLARHAQRTMVPAHLQEEAPVTKTGLGLGDASVEAAFLSPGIRNFDDLMTVLYDVNPNIAERANEIYAANYQSLGELINEDFINQFRELWFQSEYGPYEDYVQEDLLLSPDLLIPELVESQIDGLAEIHSDFSKFLVNTLALLDKYETGGTGSYDTLLAFSNLTGRDYSHVKITEMTLAEVINFTGDRGEGTYHEWSRGYIQANFPDSSYAKRNNLGSTPTGRYQFVGDTLADIVNRSGGRFNTARLYDKQLQDELFIWYIQDRLRTQSTLEGKRGILKSTWEGFTKIEDDSKLDLIIQEVSNYSGFALGGPVNTPSNTSTPQTFSNTSFKNIHITIPLASKNPEMSAKVFESYFSSYLNP